MNNNMKNFNFRITCIGLILMLCCGLSFFFQAAVNGYPLFEFIAEVALRNNLPQDVKNLAMLQLLPTVGGILLAIGGTKKMIAEKKTAESSDVEEQA
ncbi:hypothetical protein AB4559_18175 [Vibrio sp. 10N.222.51.C8]|uniref:Uncharacterized protein n=2 Tax=Vibrio cyclitrophicus TaxID=47951 RepID=A0A7Z1MLB3_9VIBR|nr:MULTISPECIES: hypothetical protein [Vibrio]PMP21902.1 hypothetical protein BCS91_19195 [Vibrio cyclitrophicus]PMP31544.1 hypothetical protein BCS90_11155 [Vibrio cyclitrophicus]TKG08590.1 hypothetical protein FCV67_08900 [Vibrio sp. F13]